MAKYFARRSLLPHQSHYFDTDGTLLVRAQISHPNQLLPVVRYWLPHVRILQPQAWHEDLVHNLNETLRLWNTTESST
jgi:predicted DNA-binding transcriptional regulator YafY